MNTKIFDSVQGLKGKDKEEAARQIYRNVYGAITQRFLPESGFSKDFRTATPLEQLDYLHEAMRAIAPISELNLEYTHLETIADTYAPIMANPKMSPPNALAKSKDYATWLANALPQEYLRQLNSGGFLTEYRQRQLHAMDIDQFHSFMMDLNTASGTNVFPWHENYAMRMMETEIGIAMMRGAVASGDKDLKILRKILCDKTLIELTQRGRKMYSTKTRPAGNVLRGDIQYKVAKAKEVPGLRWFAQEPLGYHGFLKFDLEEIVATAPSEANAVLVGNGLIINVNNGEFRSPIGNRKISTTRKDGIYQAIPLKFFSVELDKSKEYLIENSGEDTPTGRVVHSNVVQKQAGETKKKAEPAAV